MIKNILLIGAGRMGQRHLAGLKEFKGRVTVVDPSSQCISQLDQLKKDKGLNYEIRYFASLAEIPADASFDAAIIAATADFRLDHVTWVAKRNIKHLFLEKPVAQSRKVFQDILKIASSYSMDVRCNFYRRSLAYFHKTKTRLAQSKTEMPLNVVVTSGAMGLGCNGIHWIDFAVFLSGARSGCLVYGDIQKTDIKSGRGPQFNDLGGTAIYKFDNGAQLVLNVIASSSAPTSVMIYESSHAILIDQNKDLIIEYARDEASQKPNYLYGADYDRHEIPGIEHYDLSMNTRDWLNYVNDQPPFILPSLAEAELSHALLFDLLEKTGQTEFLFT